MLPLDCQHTCSNAFSPVCGQKTTCLVNTQDISTKIIYSVDSAGIFCNYQVNGTWCCPRVSEGLQGPFWCLLYSESKSSRCKFLGIAAGLTPNCADFGDTLTHLHRDKCRLWWHPYTLAQGQVMAPNPSPSSKASTLSSNVFWESTGLFLCILSS